MKARSAQERFQEWLIHRYSLRGHVTAILIATALSGVLFDRLLLELGVRAILGRYPAAIWLSYGVFLVLIKIWLHFILPHHPSPRQARAAPDTTPLSGGRWPSLWLFPNWSDRSGNVSAAYPASAPEFHGGGGRSGGGGATGSWGPSASSLGSSGSPDLDLDSGGSSHSAKIDGNAKDLGVLIAGAVLIVAIIGGAAYVIWASPAILSEAAFQFGLATGVVRRSNRAIGEDGWIESVFKRTWIPLAIILVLATLFGWIVHENCPDRLTANEVFQSCPSSSLNSPGR